MLRALLQLAAASRSAADFLFLLSESSRVASGLGGAVFLGTDELVLEPEQGAND
jgi:hypothetical protein